jgi:catechol 2,3-dioxygenase-like lactoylglutathione lyase family enzyme
MRSRHSWVRQSRLRKAIGSPDVDVGRAVVEMKTGSGLPTPGAAARTSIPYIEHMTIQRMEHVGIVVDDLPAATEFFVELGLELQGEASVEGRWVDRIVGLEGVRADIAMMQTPGGHGRLELAKFHSPSNQGGNRHAPANKPGIRHIAFAVEDIDAVVAGLRARGAELVGELERYEDSYRLCYVRGPEGIIVELAEQIG